MALVENLLSKFKSVFKKSANKITSGLQKIFNHRKIDPQSLEELEELLLSADMGKQVSAFLINKVSKLKVKQETSIEEIKTLIAEGILEILQSTERKLFISNPALQVILVCGVNGNGKTTTIAKIANKFQQKQQKVLLAACDTFRAAAKEQLMIWAERLNCEIITASEKTDPASVAYKALDYALKNNFDVLLIDTAGRLHTQSNLMEELRRITKVLKKLEPTAPHSTILVLDGTTGQNAVNQVKLFQEIININGLIITKLDGTAKGGIAVKIAQSFPGIHFYAIGTGENIEDLEDFSASKFTEALLEI